MDARTLADAMMNALPLRDYERLLSPMQNAMAAAHCTTPMRAAMWCAQIGHESSGLRHMEEIGNAAYFARYNNRADLGNGPTDGPRFYGRGPIQLTGRNNYRRFSQWAHSQGMVSSPTYFEDNPKAVSDPHWGFLAASFYWTVSRPQINRRIDEGTPANNFNLLDVSREINGWFTTPNGMPDRTRRFNHCRPLGPRLVPSPGFTPERKPIVEKVLDYPRTQIRQDTFYNCGPATAQTIIVARTGTFVQESTLGNEMGTHRGGTDHISQIARVLNARLQGSKYAVVEMPNDPPRKEQAERLWTDVRRSIDAGYGVVVNIVAPPNNYPRAVPPSTVHPAYSGGTVYHYFAIMGYRDDNGRRTYWVADSGFSPYGYWCSHEQMSTLIPPKGYAYATGGTAVPPPAADPSERPAAPPKSDERLALEQLAGPNPFDGWDFLGGRTLAVALGAIGENLGIEGMYDLKKRLADQKKAGEEQAGQEEDQ